MADTYTTSIGLTEVVATYNGAGTATGLKVRYRRTVTNVTQGFTVSRDLGPFELDIVAYAQLLTSLLNNMPSPGSGQ